MKSEKEDRAMMFLKTVDVKLKSIRLDKYYSESSYVSRFASDTAVYIIPKKGCNSKWISEVEGHDEGVCHRHLSIP